ncbi:MAG: VOC family protein [Planctomycetes bacterium]|nr:VOC family protein [Planctomycetota bacterium]
MKSPPKGWPRISSAIFYDDAAAAIDWLVEVFGFSVRLRCEDESGKIEHSELEFHGGLVMVATAGERPTPGNYRSPRALGGANSQSLCVQVDDVEGHCAHARSAGATILSEPKTQDYGEEYWADRSYLAEDLEGHLWWFVQRVRG